ncbi:MAG TPA: hypothetical protein VFC79_07870 [Tissierellaceae bacterium]|nr:hypothetical protein [Tissierellaceae bacterium]
MTQQKGNTLDVIIEAEADTEVLLLNISASLRGEFYVHYENIQKVIDICS